MSFTSYRYHALFPRKEEAVRPYPLSKICSADTSLPSLRFLTVCLWKESTHSRNIKIQEVEQISKCINGIYRTLPIGSTVFPHGSAGHSRMAHHVYINCLPENFDRTIRILTIIRFLPCRIRVALISVPSSALLFTRRSSPLFPQLILSTKGF